MLVGLGGSAPRLHDGDLVDLLIDCHRRIRRFVGMARDLADADGESEDELRDTADAVRRYFAIALPLHVCDEEDSILPRLRSRNLLIDRALRDMAREHQEHRGALDQLIASCAAIGRDPGCWTHTRTALKAAAFELDKAFTPHLDREESVVFPGIRQLLDPGQQAAILGEFRARRLQ